jgi:hypothetical protein
MRNAAGFYKRAVRDQPEKAPHNKSTRKLQKVLGHKGQPLYKKFLLKLQTTNQNVRNCSKKNLNT